MNVIQRWISWLASAASALLVFSPAPATTAATPQQPVTQQPVAAQSLTPQQLAGQRVIYSYTGLTPPADLLQHIEAGEAAGVIFFGDNISNLTQISSVIQTLDQANAQSPVKEPLLLMTDQEGGEVRRLPGGPTNSEKTIGASSDPSAEAASAGTDAGQLLASVGMNVNLAPVLDVYRTPGDFDDQYQRSYSSNPNIAASAGSAFVTAQQKTGVAATVKHFPGLGAATASEDTDTEPVTLNVSLSDLRGIDELPYPAAISAGVKLVMVSWAVYPSLDPNYPAGLSSIVVQQELRGRLGFQGVTITDALEAGALENFGTDSQRGVSAAGAGMDLLLCASGQPSQGDDVETGLVAALQSGQLNSASFNASVQRITNLRNSLS
ncbi:MAG TPA: glycoside hydrolase family 3 N-terminal domain-containing protein [Pseudonocardiaceae bacterium]|jgi:beta-N-acetylhexosaminidase|nr:glycoside hydrolase family 3 N-terminal domain-containing protein [Pseudonocardiaceae bacterium]